MVKIIPEDGIATVLMYGERRRCTDKPKGYARGKVWLRLFYDSIDDRAKRGHANGNNPILLSASQKYWVAAAKDKARHLDTK